MEKHTGYTPEDWKNDSPTGPFLDAENLEKMEKGIQEAINRTNDLIDYVDTSIINSRMMVVNCSKTRAYEDSATSIGTIPDWNSDKIAIFISHGNTGYYGEYSRVTVVKSDSTNFTSISSSVGGESSLSIRISDDGEIYASGKGAENKKAEGNGTKVLASYTMLITDSNNRTLII